MIKVNFQALQKKYGIKSKSDLDWADRILPYRFAPVLVNKKSAPEFRMMNFSLIPSWSKEPRMKFATHNARLETIAEKPTWKKPFQSQRCLVPITDFIEPIYEGEYGGNMVDFAESAGDILSAAGVWSEWVDTKSGEVIESFAIITGEPDPFVKKIGHDRQPIFLDEKSIEEWLDPKPHAPEKLISFLEEHRKKVGLTISIDRPLKSKSKK